jgi:hypothetical protein
MNSYRKQVFEVSSQDNGRMRFVSCAFDVSAAELISVTRSFVKKSPNLVKKSPEYVFFIKKFIFEN